MIVSKYSALFDPAGHFLPFTNGLKMDARRATMETEDWDSPVSLDTRKLWVVNLWKMYNMQGIHYSLSESHRSQRCCESRSPTSGCW